MMVGHLPWYYCLHGWMWDLQASGSCTFFWAALMGGGPHFFPDLLLDFSWFSQDVKEKGSVFVLQLYMHPQGCHQWTQMDWSNQSEASKAQNWTSSLYISPFILKLQKQEKYVNSYRSKKENNMYSDLMFESKDILFLFISWGVPM